LGVASKVPVIAVDGPGGAGKGTVSALLARHLGYALLESGALYRALALAASNRQVSTADVPALTTLAAMLDVSFDNDAAGRPRVFLDGSDVSRALRAETCGEAASRLASIPAVRQALLQRQRAFRRPPGLVAEGRDMGTVVFPDAQLKIFLTASLEERARRRYKQLMEQGLSAKLDGLLDELATRDERDAERQVAPLKPAEDAVIIDSTGLDIDEVFARILDLACDVQSE
jgi:cytidylate kinase